MSELQFSEHFSLTEFTHSQTADRKGIDNTIPKRLYPRITELCQHILEPMRAHFGPLIVSSGYRCPPLNKAVGGSRYSQHMSGEAADIISPRVHPLELCEWVKKSSEVPFHQCIYEYDDWCHVSIAPPGQVARGECLTIDKRGTLRGFVLPAK